MTAGLPGFDRPDLAELIARARSDLNAALPGADAHLPGSPLDVIARILSAAAHGLYGYVDWSAAQAFPLYAEDANLEAWGVVWGVARKPAAKATGAVDMTGTAEGAAIPAGAVMRRADGVEYVATASAAIAGGLATVSIEAVETGVGGNAAAGAALALVSPIAGVTSAGAVASGGVTGGASREADGAPGTDDTSTFRGRILDRIRQAPHGGAGFDYVKWALEVPGVTRAWVSPLENGLGTVTVRFMMDDAYADGVPVGDDSTAPGGPTGDVQTVYDYINALRPVTAELIVVKPVPVPLPVTITGLSVNTPETQAAVAAELADLIRRDASPGATIRRSRVVEAISIAAGEDYHTLTAPPADVPHGTGEIATLGAITYA